MFRSKFNETKDVVAIGNDNIVRLAASEALIIHLVGNPNGPSYEEIMKQRYEDVNTYEDIERIAINMIMDRRKQLMGPQN